MLRDAFLVCVLVWMLPFLAFVLSCFAVNEAYSYASSSLKAWSPTFPSLSESRQFYVIKNVIKGYYLAFLVFLGAMLVFLPMLVKGYVDNLSIRILASLYVSNDVVGLWRVKQLATTTRIHHVTSLVFLLMAWNADFEKQQVARMLLYYCYLSALSFPVNLYLGLRFCSKEEPLRLKAIAKYTYALGCLLNWSLQYKLFDNSTEAYCYLALLALIVYDDLVLLRWLWRSS